MATPALPVGALAEAGIAPTDVYLASLAMSSGGLPPVLPIHGRRVGNGGVSVVPGRVSCHTRHTSRPAGAEAVRITFVPHGIQSAANFLYE